jgi:hypothetical protein
MEHPGDQHDDAVSAMASAVSRLRGLETWDRWITFCGQGQGGSVDSYHFAEIEMLGDRIKPVGVQVDAARALRDAGLGTAVELSTSPEGGLLVEGATPLQMAKLLDAIFRGQMGIQPHDDEPGDYAVGVEW